jgi:hypothetical protein
MRIGSWTGIADAMRGNGSCARSVGEMQMHRSATRMPPLTSCHPCLKTTTTTRKHIEARQVRPPCVAREAPFRNRRHLNWTRSVHPDPMFGKHSQGRCASIFCATAYSLCKLICTFVSASTDNFLVTRFPWNSCCPFSCPGHQRTIKFNFHSDSVAALAGPRKPMARFSLPKVYSK